MDSTFYAEYWTDEQRDRWRARDGLSRDRVVLPADYTPRWRPRQDSNAAIAARALAVEGGFALLCLLLAALKLKRTRLELLRAPDA
jgi:hypothetical protein